MLLATDVHYRDDHTATAAGVVFSDWTSAKAEQTIVKEIEQVADYEPGSFYKREMPCLMELINALEIELHSIDAVIVDGFVLLGSDEKPGLGMRLYDALGQIVPVVGLAKTSFAGTPEGCKILRGTSQTPLFVTAAGMSLEKAKSNLKKMHGPHRIPTMIRLVDQICRGIRTDDV